MTAVTARVDVWRIFGWLLFFTASICKQIHTGRNENGPNRFGDCCKVNGTFRYYFFFLCRGLATDANSTEKRAAAIHGGFYKGRRNERLSTGVVSSCFEGFWCVEHSTNTHGTRTFRVVKLALALV